MFNGAAHSVRIVESFQSRLAAGTSLPKVYRIVRVALHFESASLFGTDDEAASCRTFSARGCIIRVETVIGILRHFGIWLALDKARCRTTTGQYRRSCRAYACQFKKIPPGNLIAHDDIFLSPGLIMTCTTIGELDALLSESSRDRKSTRLNSSHVRISYAVF